MPVDSDAVYQAILKHGGVAQAAEELGVSRELLYKSHGDAVERAQAERRRRLLDAPMAPVAVPMPVDLLALLDKVATAEGTSRTAVAAGILATLPETLPDPIAADGGKLVPLKAPAAVLEDLRRRCGPNTNGVIRAILKKHLAR